MRQALRNWFFDFLKRAAATDDARRIFTDLLRTQAGVTVPSEIASALAQLPPYDDVGRAHEQLNAAHLPTPVFVTGRFRSGSTMFWNLFRHLPETTSYYEPLNERRWFDPAARGSNVDPTHLNVEDYWAEYDGLSELGAYYQESWIDKHLYMSARAWDPALRQYIELLIRKAKGRAVLQFNRVDLRLPWLRATFPDARILHVFRHPRDQWYSTLRGFDGDMRSLTVERFAAHDGFYLLNWGRDLRHYFPFLELDARSHPYELFYQVWKLSYLFGRAYAHVSIAYESVLATPAESIERVLRDLQIERYDIARLAPLVSPIESGKWRKWGCDSLLTDIEARVDSVLTEYLR